MRLFAPCTWLRRFAYLALLTLAVGAVRYWLWHRDVATKLAEALAAMDRDDPGWRLEDIEAAREVIPEEENSARVVVAAAALLPADWPPQTLKDAFDRLDPPTRLDPDKYRWVWEELDRRGPALAEARKLADMPRGRYAITWARNPLYTRLNDQQRSREVMHLLRFDAIRRAEEGDLARAVVSCRAGLNTARAIGDEPCYISQLVRYAGVAIAGQTAERLLARGEAPPDDLATLQRQFEDEARHPSLLIGARGDRAMFHALLELLESGEIQLDGLVKTTPTLFERCFGWWIADRLRDEPPFYLSMAERRIAEVELPLEEQADAERDFTTDLRALDGTKRPFTRTMMPAIDKVGEAHRRKVALVRCMAITLAVERYRRSHGRWPETLEQLVPAQLTEVLCDPFDGEPLRYRRLEDGVAIYSVGADCNDDGGKFDREHPTAPGTDLGYRLWDVAQRGRALQAKE